MHGTHTVNALLDLRITAGRRLRDVFCHALFATAKLAFTFCPRVKPI